VTSIGHQEGMNDQVSITHGHLYGAKGSLCQRKDMLDHLGDPLLALTPILLTVGSPILCSLLLVSTMLEFFDSR